jgi:hypothetical protein
MTRLLLASACAAAALAASSRPARACSCIPPGFTLPADSATDVATNVELVVSNRPNYVEGDLVLTGPDGEVPIEVTTTTGGLYTFETIRPLVPLAPATTYTLESSFVLTTFETGTEADTAAPAAAEPGNLDVARAVATVGSSCGSEYRSVELDLGLPPDAVAADVAIDLEDERIEVIVSADDLLYGFSGWGSDCSLKLLFEPGDPICLEIRSRDQAGNLADVVSRCTTVTRCDDIPDSEFFDGTLDNCATPAAGGGGCRASREPSPVGTLVLLLVPLAVLRLGRFAPSLRTNGGSHCPRGQRL